MSNKSAARPLPGHQAEVLRLLRDTGEPLPRTELARRTGLSATTITKVTAQLLAVGCVVELQSGQATSGVGRPPIGLALAADSFLTCGVQVGVGFVRLGISDLLARVTRVAGFEFDTSDPQAEVVDRIAQHVVALWTDTGREASALLAVGVAAPGPVDDRHRRNLLSINLGWRDVDFVGPLEAATGAPAVVDHNVRAMALAESRYGEGRGRESLAYVYIRTGVGAGLVLHGQPFRGGTHGVSELGHLHVVEKGRRCACGAFGCLETVVSQPYLAERVAAATAAEPTNALAKALEGGTDVLTALEHAAADGDTQARSLLDETCGHLATGLASVVNLLNPELILLGGIFSDAPETTVDRVRRQLRAEAFPILRDAVQIERSSLGLDAGIVGACAVALDHFFYAPTSTP